MSEKKEYHWIDDSVKIDFEIPGRTLRNTIADAEAADLAGDYAYFGYADLICNVDAKALVAAGKLTHKQWDVICARYREDLFG